MQGSTINADSIWISMRNNKMTLLLLYVSLSFAIRSFSLEFDFLLDTFACVCPAKQYPYAWSAERHCQMCKKLIVLRYRHAHWLRLCRLMGWKIYGEHIMWILWTFIHIYEVPFRPIIDVYWRLTGNRVKFAVYMWRVQLHGANQMSIGICTKHSQMIP